MKPIDIIILLILGLLIFLAVRYMLRHKGCTGCSGCQKDCPYRQKSEKEKEDGSC